MFVDLSPVLPCRTDKITLFPGPHHHSSEKKLKVYSFTRSTPPQTTQQIGPQPHTRKWGRANLSVLPSLPSQMAIAQSIDNVTAQKTALLRHQGRDPIRGRQRKISTWRPKGLHRQSSDEEEGSESSEAPELVDISALAPEEA